MKCQQLIHKALLCSEVFQLRAQGVFVTLRPLTLMPCNSTVAFLPTWVSRAHIAGQPIG